MAKWNRYDERPKNQKFICPHCNRVCHNSMHANLRTYCDYAFCPYCGMEVEPDEVPKEDKA